MALDAVLVAVLVGVSGGVENNAGLGWEPLLQQTLNAKPLSQLLNLSNVFSPRMGLVISILGLNK